MGSCDQFGFGYMTVLVSAGEVAVFPFTSS